MAQWDQSTKAEGLQVDLFPALITKAPARTRYPNQAIMAERDLTLVAEKLALVLYANALQDLSRDRHSIALKDLLKQSGVRTKNLSEVKQSLVALQHSSFRWGSLDSIDEKEQWGSIPMLGGALIDNGVVTYALDPMLRERLDEFTYALIDLEEAASFSSKHSFRLHLLCRRYERVGSTGHKAISFWYKVFDLPLTTPYKRFRREVLAPAITDVERRTDLRIEYETRGRPTASVRLQIDVEGSPTATDKSNVRVRPDVAGSSTAAPAAGTLVDEVYSDFGVARSRVEELIDQRGIETVNQGLQELRRLRESGFKPAKAWPGYAWKLLCDFEPVPETVQLADELAAKQSPTERRRAIEAEARAKKEAEERRRVAEANARRSQAEDWFDQLSASVQRDLREAYKVFSLENQLPNILWGKIMESDFSIRSKTAAASMFVDWLWDNHLGVD